MISRALHRFILFAALCTLVLVVVGGLVTSHGVGMAVPDWPNTYGYNMFFFPVSRWVGGVFYEHTHRLVASGVGLLTTIIALWMHGRPVRRVLRWLGMVLLTAGLAGVLVTTRRADATVLLITGATALAGSCFWPRMEPAPRWLRNLGLAAFIAVLIQGLLGGLRVVLFKDEIGIVHAALAQLFFVLMCALALFTSQWWQKSVAAHEVAGKPNPRARRLFMVGTILIFAQLVLGATMRHQHAGLAIPDFPSAYGRLWPRMDPESVASYNRHRIEVIAANPITTSQIGLQMAHRILAMGILVVVGLAAWSARRTEDRRVRMLGWGWFGLIGMQVLLGAATIWSNKAADVATGHVLVGALSLALGVILCIVFSPVAFLRKTTRSAGVVRPISPTWQRPATATGSN